MTEEGLIEILLEHIPYYTDYGEGVIECTCIGAPSTHGLDSYTPEWRDIADRNWAEHVAKIIRTKETGNS
ncbi:hypothetical protein SEA_KABOCHA_113 [Gordonia phage Kabocha]|uniref:Uncharacterized protein n=1 Tax=Gordonia phage Chidiebere TaxID=2656530 RepID=A0A649VKY0_9CAUD|nr:hypothetical protein PQD14_gp112 [Gordonia phage Chidiebere]QGJ92998.1 hypothetical protein PBI_CHIDIEBERE_112 [Gordonia phage Chidiebere]WAA19899.1 hypothetical protein SEA_KABOCHA_113 [Gordonia phage Kabocha]WAA20088.1 hypothetical protein SEA_HANEM_111 [Gordonia phage Hanem]WNM67131.1 hypothetical protein SEA_SCHOMBER_110 [Gordonia Phage Schomber]